MPDVIPEPAAAARLAPWLLLLVATGYAWWRAKRFLFHRRFVRIGRRLRALEDAPPPAEGLAPPPDPGAGPELDHRPLAA